MNPLGPFNGKNFMTSIPPWGRHAISVEAIRSCGSRTYATVARFMDDHNSINYSIELGGTILRHGIQSTTCNVGFETMYCTFRHMLAHHTIGGCNLRTGDLIASGTVSGEQQHEYGCLMELTKNAKLSIALDDGSELRYLEDGDETRYAGVVGKGIGFGCVKPARQT
jgi:fumarylacetoacetase